MIVNIPRRTTAALAFLGGLTAAGLSMFQPAYPHVARGGICPESNAIPYSSRDLATQRGVYQRCILLQKIESQGPLAPSSLRTKVLKELSNRFKVEIGYSGIVSLPRQAVEYLLNNVQGTAALVSDSSGTGYKAIQSVSTHDPKWFFVADGKTFAARFTYLYSRNTVESSEHMFFESGHATVFLWRIWGNSIIQYKLTAVNEQQSSYDIKVYVFTESRLLKAILRSGLFRYFSRAMFTKILSDIETAAHRFKETRSRFDNLTPEFIEGLEQVLR